VDQLVVAPGLYVNGSSLPNVSVVPVATAFAARACERWTASSIIRAVVVVGFFVPTVEDEITPPVEVVGVVAADAVWAAAGEATEVKVSAPAAPAPMIVKIVLRVVIVFSCIGRSPVIWGRLRAESPVW
jgi:hypothetical protein